MKMTEYNKHSPQALVPYGLLVTRKWILSQGIERHTLDNWIKSKQLISVTQGVYTRPDTKLTWTGIVNSLQKCMGYDLSVGGITALNLLGHGHYAELGNVTTVHLYGNTTPPKWINQLLDNVQFIRHKTIFEQPTALRCAPDLETLTISTAERAWFEILMDVPKNISFEHADQLMQGLVNLSPNRLNQLLEACQNIKVRRLFLWFGEHHKHAWFKKINTENFTIDNGRLGSGKRMLVKGGKLDPKYLITVPTEMYESKINE